MANDNNKIKYVSIMNLSANVKYPVGGKLLSIVMCNITVAISTELTIPILSSILSVLRINDTIIASIKSKTGRKFFMIESVATLSK